MIVLGAMALGKVTSVDPAAAAAMAGNREALKKLDGTQTSEIYTPKAEVMQDPPKKKEEKDDINDSPRIA